MPRPYPMNNFPSKIRLHWLRKTEDIKFNNGNGYISGNMLAQANEGSLNGQSESHGESLLDFSIALTRFDDFWLKLEPAKNYCTGAS